MPPMHSASSQSQQIFQDPRVVAAHQDAREAMRAEPTDYDTERAFAALKLHGTRQEDGAVSFTDADGHSFRFTEGPTMRVLTWRAPENFPTVLLANGVTDEARLAFLEVASKEVWPKIIQNPSDVVATLKALAGLQSDRITDGKLSAEGLLRFNQFTMERDEIPSLGSFEVTKGSNGFELTSNINLSTGKIGETRYLFDVLGRPVGDHASAESSPIDALLSSVVTRTNRMIWSLRDTEAPWERNTHLQFTLEGTPIDFAQDGPGFSEGTKALLKAFSMTTRATEAALEKLERVIEQVRTAEGAAPQNPFDDLTLPRPR